MPHSSPSLPTHLKTTLTSHTGPVHCVAFSSGSGQYILSGSSDRTIHLSNPTKPPSQQLIQSYSGAHGHEVLDLAPSPDNASFASVGGDRLVYLWDVSHARTIRRWSGHFGRVNCVALGGGGGGGGDNASSAAASGGGGGGGPLSGGSASYNVVVSGSFDATVRIWDVRSPGTTRAVQVLEEAGDSVSAVVVGVGAAGGRCYEIVSGCVDGRVRCYDLRMGVLYTDVIGPAVTSLAATRDGNGLLVSSLDSTIRLMDKADGKCLQRYGGAGEEDGGYRNRELRVRSCLGAGDSLVLGGSEDGGLYAWDVLGGNLVGKVKEAHGGKVASAVAWNGVDGRRREWASGGMDGKVRVWGVEG